MKKISLFITFLFVFSCIDKRKGKTNISDEKTDFITLLNSQQKNIDFDLIQIKNLREEMESTTDTDTLSSKQWNIDVLKFRKILELSVPISEAEKHYAYDIKLKSIEGNIIYDKHA